MSSGSDDDVSSVMSDSQLMVVEGGDSGEERPQYANKCELMLSLVGYAVGLGNIWRFPYLCYDYGGAAFLIPYFLALILLGLPLFVLELGLGQLFRQGTLGIWEKIGRRRMQGVGVAATICTFLVSMYYNVILAWTIYFMGATAASWWSGVLPWSHEQPGFECPPAYLVVNKSVRNATDLLDSSTGLFNATYRESFWCPQEGIPSLFTAEFPSDYVKIDVTPKVCPARAAVKFWEVTVLQQSSGMDNMGGFNWGLLAAFTIAWILIYSIVFKGVGSSGKVVYVTAILPYVSLTAFFIRAITLPNAMTGLKFFLQPHLSKLMNFTVWQRAVTQIFYSLGVGFGSLIAFASYGDKKDDYVGNAQKVAVINCSTSMFAGFVVFPILGYLAQEMAGVNPCFVGEDLGSLSSIGLSGTSLAFIAFPIAISRMPFPFTWSFLFFLTLLCLGIDSEFAMVESVMTVISDSKMAPGLSKPVLAGIVCGVSWLLGLVFVTKAGIYWFSLFDCYTCVVAMFFVTFMEVFWVMWGGDTFELLRARTKEYTGRTLNAYYVFCWRWVCPIIIVVLALLALATHDIMHAESSKPYPEGAGLLPSWSIQLGWKLGLLPVAAWGLIYFVLVERGIDSASSPEVAKLMTPSELQE